MTTLTTSMMSNGSTIHGSLQPLSIIPHETSPPLLLNLASISCNNKSIDAKKYTLSNFKSIIDLFLFRLNLLDSWKWPKSSRVSILLNQEFFREGGGRA